MNTIPSRGVAKSFPSSIEACLRDSSAYGIMLSPSGPLVGAKPWLGKVATLPRGDIPRGIFWHIPVGNWQAPAAQQNWSRGNGTRPIRHRRFDRPRSRARSLGPRLYSLVQQVGKTAQTDTSRGWLNAGRDEETSPSATPERCLSGLLRARQRAKASCRMGRGT